MKNSNQIILVLSVIATFSLGLVLGIYAAKKEYKDRFLQLQQKEYYSNKEVQQLLK